MPSCDLLDESSLFGPFWCCRLELKKPASSEVRELREFRFLRPIYLKVRKAARSAPRTAAAMAMPATGPPLRQLGELVQGFRGGLVVTEVGGGLVEVGGGLVEVGGGLVKVVEEDEVLS
jgi:hypothetical protein